MAPMVCTTCLTAWPPWLATCVALPASSLDLRVWSAFCLTLEVSCSSEEAVSSRALACSSVREERSRLPVAIWVEAVTMESVPRRTSSTMALSFWFIAASACSRRPVSSVEWASITAVRSPAATVSATSTARLSGRVMLREMVQAMKAANRAETRPETSMIRRVVL